MIGLSEVVEFEIRNRLESPKPKMIETVKCNGLEQSLL